MQKLKSPKSRNALRRARICEKIRFDLALEDLDRRNSKREVWARLAIGLKPYPRHHEAVQ